MRRLLFTGDCLLAIRLPCADGEVFAGVCFCAEKNRFLSFSIKKRRYKSVLSRKWLPLLRTPHRCADILKKAFSHRSLSETSTISTIYGMVMKVRSFFGLLYLSRIYDQSGVAFTCRVYWGSRSPHWVGEWNSGSASFLCLNRKTVIGTLRAASAF